MQHNLNNRNAILTLPHMIVIGISTLEEKCHYLSSIRSIVNGEDKATLMSITHFALPYNLFNLWVLYTVSGLNKLVH